MCDIMGGGRRVLTGLGRVPAGGGYRARDAIIRLLGRELASATVCRTNHTSYDLIVVSKVRRTT